MARLTAQDIAEHIQGPGESLTAAVDRLRNWTKMGIIKPSGERHPGTGKKKRYSTNALVQAVILQTLTDALGAPAVSIGPALRRLSQELEQIGRAKPGTNVAIIGRRPGSPELKIGICDQSEVGEYISKSDLDVHTVINLTHINDSLKFAHGEIP